MTFMRAARGTEHIADATIELPQHYIDIEGSLVQRALRTLKHGDAFAVFDNYGDIGVIGTGPEGLYFNDTRFLSWYGLWFEGKRPLLLSSVVQDDNAALSVNLANPDVHIDGVISLPRGTIAIERTKFLWQAVCFERIGFRNYADSTRHFRIDIGFGADFRDLFEIRGTSRTRRGTSTSLVTEDGAGFHYEGLDNVKRKTELRFSPSPTRLETNCATFEFELAPNTRRSLFVSVLCEDRNEPRINPFGRAFRARRRAIRSKATGIATIESSNELFNEVCRQATADLYMLMTRTSHGLYPYAGIPWYSTAFGRDEIITAMLLLWLDPTVAKGVLHFLAATQAKTFDPFADAQPGKILHETRNGEMARLREVPFGLYYGTVDATPLYVMLAGMYFDRTGDIETIAAIWPNIKAALQWIDTFGDADGDGFVEYARQNASGLVNQGWKDSFDAIFHADGALAEGPIALCEVQGYVFAAKTHAAKLAHRVGEYDLETGLRGEAQGLQQKFEAAFWCEDLGTFALALDGDKSMPGPDIECGPCAIRRDRRAGTGGTRRRDIAWPGFVQWMGDQNGRERRGAIQSDFLSQRLGLAARQRDNSAWSCPLWPPVARGQGLLRDVRSGSVPGVAPPAGVVLRLHPQAAPRPDGLSRCLRPASLGVGRAFCLSRGLSWHGAAS